MRYIKIIIIISDMYGKYNINDKIRYVWKIIGGGGLKPPAPLLRGPWRSLPFFSHFVLQTGN